MKKLAIAVVTVTLGLLALATAALAGVNGDNSYSYRYHGDSIVVHHRCTGTYGGNAMQKDGDLVFFGEVATIDGLRTQMQAVGDDLTGPAEDWLINGACQA